MGWDRSLASVHEVTLLVKWRVEWCTPTGAAGGSGGSEGDMSHAVALQTCRVRTIISTTQRVSRP
jgi:hypothetical protein